MMNRIVRCVVVLVCSVGSLTAQVPPYRWAKSAGGNDFDYAWGMSVDGSGDVYVTGGFQSTDIVFGQDTLKNALAGVADFFIAKYNSSGGVVWARGAGGSDFDYGRSIGLDSSGNIYVTGYFRSPFIVFGSDTLTNANPPYADLFIVKYDSGGRVLWATSADGSSDDYGYAVAVDRSGNCYVTGSFRSLTLKFGSITLMKTAYADIYIVKYDPDGKPVWAMSAGGGFDDVAQGIAVDPSGNSYVTGYFYSPVIAFGPTVLTNSGSGDMFIAKYDTSGTVVWAKKAGGQYDDEGYSVSADAFGNIYVAGYFFSPSITFGSTTLTNTGASDIFLVKYDRMGDVIWARRAGGTSDDEAYGVSVDTSGYSYITGYFFSPDIAFDTTVLTNAGSYDIFIAKYDTGGRIVWAKGTGGADDDIGQCIALDASGNAYITGGFISSPIVFDADTLWSAGGYDVVVAKVGGKATSVSPGVEDLPGAFSLRQNYPNPFNPATTITYQLANRTHVTLKIFDLLGREIITLVDEIQEPGYKSVRWDTEKVPSGIYFYRIIAGSFTETKKMTLLR